MNKRRVMVTGCCGFIGHHLVRQLKNLGFYVIGIDNLSTGKEEWSSLPQEFYKDDINELTVFNFKDIEYVFHMAALARVPFSIEQPFVSNNTNVTGTLNMLIRAKDAGVKKFVYSASSSAYGNQDEMPLTEWMLPNPESPYAVQKLVGEYYAKVFNKVYGLPTVCLRYFNVFGEEQPADNPYTGVITKFFEHRRNNEALPIYGDGEQTRDFTYVGDVVSANILAATSTADGVYNIGSGKRYSINDIAGFIGGEREYLPARVGDPLDTLADNASAEFMLNWKPTVNLETWIKNQLG